ncbi:MAG: hypothetical protein KC535_05235, partial [Nanoarchaeota archaeon]|nr:hypothetical protein [Nanoarchaeota archaeon]
MKYSKIDFFEILSGFYLLFVLFLILVIAAVGDHKIFLVLVGLFPTILTIMVSLMIHEQFSKGTQLLWLLPIITSAGFYSLSLIPDLALGSLDIPVLTGVNFLLSILYVLIVFSVFKNARHHEHRKETKEEKEMQEVVMPVPEQTIEEIIHSIEDKSKALNFVVGRVYNKYHGGTTEMREKLRIPAEWYNDFSLIGFGTDHIDYHKLQEIIA